MATPAVALVLVIQAILARRETGRHDWVTLAMSVASMDAKNRQTF
jgi:hypothetical protein